MYNFQAEERFYSSKFYFSYSGLNKLLYSPTIFYKNYILNEREERTDAHLVEGRLLHCLLLDESSFDKQFVLSPTSVPTGGTKTLIDRLFRQVCEENKLDQSLDSLQSEILLLMQELNFYQKLKTDNQRIEKICTDDASAYFEFLKSKSGKDIVDLDTYQRIKDSLIVIRDNQEAMSRLGDFDKHHIQSEISLMTDMPSYSFGLKGTLDRLIIDGDVGRVIDFKTTSKTLSEFKDTVEYYNYWLQAAIYLELVAKIYNLSHISFTFIVIDKYKQVYCFDVSDESVKIWKNKLHEKLEIAKYHYDNRSYSLPHEFLINKVML